MRWPRRIKINKREVEREKQEKRGEEHEDVKRR